jgi:hypothetical protein
MGGFLWTIDASEDRGAHPSVMGGVGTSGLMEKGWEVNGGVFYKYHFATFRLLQSQ